MAEDYTWTFRTMAPQTLSIQATKPSQRSTRLDSGFSVSFSQPMDTASTEAAFSLWQEPDDRSTDEVEQGADVLIQGVFHWNKTHTYLTFKPRQFLCPSHTYTVEMTATASNADGSAILKDVA
jgi:hypothetical protein